MCMNSTRHEGQRQFESEARTQKQICPSLSADTKIGYGSCEKHEARFRKKFSKLRTKEHGFEAKSRAKRGAKQRETNQESKRCDLRLVPEQILNKQAQASDSWWERELLNHENTSIKRETANCSETPERANGLLTPSSSCDL